MGRNGNWSMTMRWHDLLFMHWPVPAEQLRPLIPSALHIDMFDSTAWIGVVPFRMSNVRPRYIPPLPWLSAFAELNVRTYVTHRGKAGVWFFSLDAARSLAVWTARKLFHLPYFNANMSVRANGEQISYRSRRTHKGAPACSFAARYWPTGAVYQSANGSLDEFLTERYCLFSADSRQSIYRCDILHGRWPLQPAEVEVETNTMTEPLGIHLPDTQPLLHFAKRVDVDASTIRPV